MYPYSFKSYPMKSQFSWLRTQDPLHSGRLCCGISACDQKVEDEIPGAKITMVGPTAGPHCSYGP